MPGTFGRAAVWDGARQPGCDRARGSLRLARVAELVANRDHAVDLPYRRHQPAGELSGVRAAGEGHYPVVHGDGNERRVRMRSPRAGALRDERPANVRRRSLARSGRWDKSGK